MRVRPTVDVKTALFRGAPSRVGAPPDVSEPTARASPAACAPPRDGRGAWYLGGKG